MKEVYVTDLTTGQEIVEFFMIKSCQIRTGSNGKMYFDLKLGDRTGEVSAKKWDVQETDVERLETYQEGDIIRVKAQVTEWQSAKQLRVLRIRKASAADAIDIREYVQAAPEDSEEMFQYLRSTAESMKDPDFRSITLRVLDENHDQLLYYPAAVRIHHAMYGGLLYHTKKMLMNGLGVAEVYPELDRDLLASGIILHDIMKTQEILSNEYGVSPGYSMEGQFLGHLVMGVKYVDKMADEMRIPEEKKLMLEQMILSHHYEPEFGSPVRPLFPEGEVLHYLDILDARLYEMFDILSSVDPGHFSDRIWSLENRRIYRRKGAESVSGENGKKGETVSEEPMNK